MTITELEQFGGHLDGFPISSLGDFYAHVSIDGVELSTFNHRFDFDGGFILPSGPLIPHPSWVLVRNISPNQGTVAIRIEIIDYDSLSESDLADINPGPKRVVDLEVNLTTGRWMGDVEWPENCVTGTGGNAVKTCFDISLGDEDGDGLLDGWELSGFDANGDGSIDVNLPALGANPQRKDIFVEVDCLVAATHSHCPRQDAIDDVVRPCQCPCRQPRWYNRSAIACRYWFAVRSRDYRSCPWDGRSNWNVR